MSDTWDVWVMSNSNIINMLISTKKGNVELFQPLKNCRQNWHQKHSWAQDCQVSRYLAVLRPVNHYDYIGVKDCQVDKHLGIWYGKRYSANTHQIRRFCCCLLLLFKSCGARKTTVWLKLHTTHPSLAAGTVASDTPPFLHKQVIAWHWMTSVGGTWRAGAARLLAVAVNWKAGDLEEAG